MLFKASAPGSLMLLGEYAVLQGKPALVCAVNKRMHVMLTPRKDKQIILTSALGHCSMPLSQLKIIPPFQFVLAALKFFKKYIKTGCEIKIESEFSEKIGFASSAAVTVSTVAAVAAWLDLSYSQLELASISRKIVRSVQGMGSGADVAACVMGGMVAYRARPFSIEKLPALHPITVVYSGSKTPTVEAIKFVENKFTSHPDLYQQLCLAIGKCATLGIAAARSLQWAKLGDMMNTQQGLMDALGVNTPVLQDIVNTQRQNQSVLGAKISGSGLGDCVVALGADTTLSMTMEGVHCVKA